MLSQALLEQLGAAATSELVSNWAGDGYEVRTSDDQLCLSAAITMDTSSAADAASSALVEAIPDLRAAVRGNRIDIARCMPR
jgi:hypothetical protein